MANTHSPEWPEVHVIIWTYSDGPALGVLRAYENLSDAEDDYGLLLNEAMSGKTFELVSIRVRPSLSKATGEKQS